MTTLLHDPWIRFYVEFVAALLVACLWDYLGRRSAAHGAARTARKEMTPQPPGRVPSGGRQSPPSVRVETEMTYPLT
jgi:hypothetical protein